MMATRRQVNIFNYQRTIGMTTMEGKGFYYPSDMVFSPNGKMYVLNRSIEGRGGGRGRRVTICDVNDEYYGDWGVFGKGPGEFMWPSAICVTSEGSILVSDEYLNKVIVFSEDGGYLKEWGELGPQLKHPIKMDPVENQTPQRYLHGRQCPRPRN